jgi:hypothetical protein
MRPDDVKEYLDRLPFQPFVVHLSTGKTLEIRQPALATVTRSTLTLGLEIEGDRQRFVVISLIHIVWLEILLPTP